MEKPWENPGDNLKIMTFVWNKVRFPFLSTRIRGGRQKKNFSKYIGLIQSWWGREEKKKLKK